MNLKITHVICALLAGNCAVSAFTLPQRKVAFTNSALKGLEFELEEAIAESTDYEAGVADNAFAKKFGSYAGKERKTVGEAFASFTEILGQPINALYKNMMSDLVGTTHLIVTDVRFERDPIWSLGIITALETLLQNYPEEGFGTQMITSLITSIEMDEATIRAEADAVLNWIAGKTEEDVAAALKGEGDGPVFEAGEKARSNEFFKYSRFYGVGLTRIMKEVGVEENDNYSTMEKWVGTCLGKPFYTACSDNDLWMKTKTKLEMMETMMKEIEIREKKKMAERLEERAEMALQRAQEEAAAEKELAEKIAAEKAALTQTEDETTENETTED